MNLKLHDLGCDTLNDTLVIAFRQGVDRRGGLENLTDAHMCAEANKRLSEARVLLDELNKNCITWRQIGTQFSAYGKAVKTEYRLGLISQVETTKLKRAAQTTLKKAHGLLLDSFANDHNLSIANDYRRRALALGPGITPLTKALQRFGYARKQELNCMKELRTRYRRQIRSVHPDHNPDDPNAAQKTVEVKAAHELLKKFLETQNGSSKP